MCADNNGTRYVQTQETKITSNKSIYLTITNISLILISGKDEKRKTYRMSDLLSPYVFTIFYHISEIKTISFM